MQLDKVLLKKNDRGFLDCNETNDVKGMKEVEIMLHVCLIECEYLRWVQNENHYSGAVFDTGDTEAIV